MNLIDLISIVSLISAGLYFTKLKEKHDLTYLASGLSRIYLAVILTALSHFQVATKLTMKDAEVAILAVIVADIFTSSIYLLGKKYIREIEYSKTVAKLKELGGKFSIIVETAITGFFTTDRKGNIEFANQSLANLLDCSVGDLVGKNLFDFVDIDQREKILMSSRFNCPSVTLKTMSGKTKTVFVSGGATRNGHETITGSIIEIY